MWHYIHHILFDPLSAWEKFKADLFGTAVVIALIVTLYLLAGIVGFFNKRSTQ